MALGATRWETLKTAVIPPALSGIVGAVILALGARSENNGNNDGDRQQAGDIGINICTGIHACSVIANEFAEPHLR